MVDVRYMGMTFVYNDENYRDENLAEKVVKMLDILVRKYGCSSGMTVSKIGGAYYGNGEVIGWQYEDPKKYLWKPDEEHKEDYRIIFRKEVRENFNEDINDFRWYSFWRKFGSFVKWVEFSEFPPKRYLEKWGISYDEKFPFPERYREGKEVSVIRYYNWPNKLKPFVSLDFGTFEDYIYTRDEKLARAVEEFLVDLMRDIVEATEPEYAYFFYDEREPLDLDPLCEGNKEIYWWVYEDKEEVGLLIGEFMAIKKSVFGNLFGAIDEFKSRAECSLGNLVVEDLGDYYLMYCDGPFGVIYYGGGREAEKYRKIFELARRVGADIIIDKVCGNVDAEIKIRATVVRRVMSKEEGKRRIEEEAKKLGLNIGKMKITEI